MALQTQSRYGFEDYLAMEELSRERHEFVAGEVFAMTGASENHNLIVANLVMSLGTQMKGRPCRVYVADMKVRIDAADMAAYPDLTAVCGERRFYDQRRNVLLNPTLIVEVLSPSTEAYDRGDKFACYRRLDSLRDYLLVAQDRTRIELYTRQDHGGWLLTEYAEPGAEVALASVDCRLLLGEVYDKVEFPPSLSAAPSGETADR